jgi:hypothetical protein
LVLTRLSLKFQTFYLIGEILEKVGLFERYMEKGHAWPTSTGRASEILQSDRRSELPN